MEPLPEIKDFEVLSCLGYGARSTIYAVCENRTRQVYALKRVIRRSAEDDRFLEQATQEYQISSQFKHPALRKSHRLIKKRKFLTTVELHLVMDMVDGISLDSERPTNLRKLLEIACQVARGLSAMHKLGYVHADIKPNNILVAPDGQCKIIDFGQSCAIGTVKSRVQVTPDYIAPEQVALGPLTPATDVFNFGATFYWYVTDRHVPTAIPKRQQGLATVASRELVSPHEINSRIPVSFSKLILECIENRPSDRPHSMEDVLSRLELALSLSSAIRLDDTLNLGCTAQATASNKDDTVT